MPVRTIMTAIALSLLLLGCGSNTDITRTDDDVEEWVEEQRHEEQERQQQGQNRSLPTATPDDRPETAPPGPDEADEPALE
ncbi:MAG: hypothetical protein PVI30_10655 [Myxococcales bacterium]|jgi:hypothetical protein